MPHLIGILEQHIIKSLPEYTALAGLFMINLIAAMTHPAVVDKWLGAWKPIDPGKCFALRLVWQKLRDLLSMLYKMWFDALQAFMSSRFPHQPPQNPQPPAEPAQSQK